MSRPALALLLGVVAASAACGDREQRPAPPRRTAASPATRALVEHAVTQARARFEQARTMAAERAVAESVLAHRALSDRLLDDPAALDVLVDVGGGTALLGTLGSGAAADLDQTPGVLGALGAIPDSDLAGVLGGIDDARDPDATGGVVGGVVGGPSVGTARGGGSSIALSLRSVDDGVDSSVVFELSRALQREAVRCWRQVPAGADTGHRRLVTLTGRGHGQTTLRTSDDDHLARCLSRVRLGAELPAGANVTYDLTVDQP